MFNIYYRSNINRFKIKEKVSKFKREYNNLNYSL